MFHSEYHFYMIIRSVHDDMSYAQPKYDIATKDTPIPDLVNNGIELMLSHRRLVSNPLNSGIKRRTQIAQRLTEAIIAPNPRDYPRRWSRTVFASIRRDVGEIPPATAHADGMAEVVKIGVTAPLKCHACAVGQGAHVVVAGAIGAFDVADVEGGDPGSGIAAFKEGLVCLGVAERSEAQGQKYERLDEHFGNFDGGSWLGMLYVLRGVFCDYEPYEGIIKGEEAWPVFYICSGQADARSRREGRV